MYVSARQMDVADSPALRAADSLVLPLNTTQYAIELGYYLEKYVPG